jgi:DNA-directed RNA polymerase subunit RPC12/RpoP
MDHQRALRPFLPKVKNCCANYSAMGPYKRLHYCSLEPAITKTQCVMFHGIACRWWFDEAVIRGIDRSNSRRKRYIERDEKLIVQWRQTLEQLRRERTEKVMEQQRSAPSSASGDKSTKLCECGNEFKPTSNRQRFCPDCSERNLRKLQSEASKRYRDRVTAS